MIRYLAAIALLLASPAAWAKPYTVDLAKSKITFNVTHSGKPVQGMFEKWEAKIDFDAANLAGSSISATIPTGTAHTGEAIYDGTLPSSDWLNAEKFPQATFASTSIEKTGEGKYVAHGLLTLKGQGQKVDLPFALLPADGKPAKDGEMVEARGEFIIDRLAAGVGVASDPKAQWVAKDVKLAVLIMARAAP